MILPSRGGDWKLCCQGNLSSRSGILPSRGGDWKRPCCRKQRQSVAIFPSRGGDWKPGVHGCCCASCVILPSRGGDWKHRGRRHAADFAGIPPPSRGGDWKPVSHVQVIYRPRSSPRGEVTGNMTRVIMSNPDMRSSPRGEVTGNFVYAPRKESDSLILPSRGGDWKRPPNGRPDSDSGDPPLAGR